MVNSETSKVDFMRSEGGGEGGGPLVSIPQIDTCFLDFITDFSQKLFKTGSTSLQIQKKTWLFASREPNRLLEVWC